jgi:hypothetical protein
MLMARLCSQNWRHRRDSISKSDAYRLSTFNPIEIPIVLSHKDLSTPVFQIIYQVTNRKSLSGSSIESSLNRRAGSIGQWGGLIDSNISMPFKQKPGGLERIGDEMREKR